MTVTLGSVKNYQQAPAESNKYIPLTVIIVQSLMEASIKCRDYIRQHDLGAGNWNGGLVEDEHNMFLANISYNGRAWGKGGYEIKLIEGK